MDEGADRVDAGPSVLLVPPPGDAASMLAQQLASLGCDVQHVHDTARMREALAPTAPHAPRALLLVGPDALDALRELRRHARRPVLMLVPSNHAIERVVALESGADDAMGHPVEPRERLARLRALLRRAPRTPAPERYLSFGAWRLDLQLRELHAATSLRVPLSHAEFKLLRTFVERPGSVLGRDELMDLACGRSMQAFERSIDLLVSRLRAKLHDDPRAPQPIRTVRGVGYLFDLFGIEHAAAPAAPAASPAVFPARYQAANSA